MEHGIKTAPGAAPELQGHYAYAWGQPRTPPEWHPAHHSEEWRAAWLKGYDQAAIRDKWGN